MPPVPACKKPLHGLDIDMVDNELPAEGSKRSRKQREVPFMVSEVSDDIGVPVAPADGSKRQGRVKAKASYINGGKFGSKKQMEERAKARLEAGETESDVEATPPKKAAKKRVRKIESSDEEDGEGAGEEAGAADGVEKKPDAAGGAANGEAGKEDSILTFGNMAPGMKVKIFNGKFLDAVGLIKAFTGKDRKQSAESLRNIISDGSFDASNLIDMPKAGIFLFFFNTCVKN